MTRILALAFVMLIALTSRAQSLVITTVAGGGVGDRGPALNANLNLPKGIAFDAGGNLYIADQEFHRVRRVDHASGIITTYAGTGFAGFSGDGGSASSAMLSSPAAVVFDAAGNLYIADSGNDRIRKVDAVTRTIYTIAGGGDASTTESAVGDGGPATSAVLAYPSALAMDASGANLYIADQYNARVRRIELATGMIQTVAGDGRVGYSGDGGPAIQARLNNPTAIAVAANGDVYIADRNNARVRKLDAHTGFLTTVAGGGVLDELLLYPYPDSLPFNGDEVRATDIGLLWPQAVALDAQGNVFISDAALSLVLRVDASSGVMTSIAYLYSGVPVAMTFDSAGNLFVSDEMAGIVERVGMDGTTDPIAGNADWGFAGDGGNALDAAMLYPAALAFGTSGELYAADGLRIRRIDPDGLIQTVIGGGFTSALRCPSTVPLTSLRVYPTGIAVDRSGLFYMGTLDGVVCTIGADGRLHEFAGDPFGDYIDIFGNNGDGQPATVASISGVDSIALEANGDVFIGDGNVGRVRIVRAADGIIDTFAGSGKVGFSGDGGPARQAKLAGPLYLAFDQERFLYICDTGNNRVRRVDFASGIITTVAGNGIAAFSGDGGSAVQASLSAPQGIAVDAAGNLYIADTGNNRIRKVLRDSGIVVTIAGTGVAGFGGDGGDALQAALDGPTGLAFDAMGTLYVSDSNNARVRKLVRATSP